MASAYELMLVLRGRNYLSNDLRKASADIAGLSRKNALTSLGNQKKAIELRQQQLTQSRKLAEAEQASIRTGPRRVAMNQAIAQHSITQANALQQVRRAQTAVTDAEKARLKNAQEISRLQRVSQSAGGFGGRTQYEQKQLLKAAQMNDQTLAERAATARRQVEIAGQAYSNTAIQAQKLVESEAALGIRDAHLTDIINTRNDALLLEADRLEQVELATLKTQSRVGQFAKVAESAGRTMQTFGLVVTAAFAGAAYAAAKFSTAGTLAGTQLVTAGRNTPQNITRIGSFVNQGLLSFMASGQSVASAADLQQAAYNIPSGIPSLKGDSIQKAKETLTLIKEFNKVTKANYGLVDLNGVTEAGIILINTFGTSIKRLPGEFDVMQSAVNRGKVTMGQFVSGLSQTAPAAKAAGYNFDAMASTLSFLSGKLPQYSRVAVGYARALELFQNNKFEQYMKSKGDAITDLNGKLLPYNTIIQQILKADPALAHGGNLIAFLKQASGASGFMQARRVLTVSLQDQAGLNRAAQEVPANARGLVNASATALSKTGAVKWKELTTQLKAVVIEIGQGVIPVFQQLAKPLEAALNWFNKLSPGTKKLVGEIGVITGLVGLLGGTLLVTVGMFARAYLSIKELGIGFKLLSGSAGELSVGLGAGLGLLILIPLMIKYHTQIENVIKSMGGMKSVLAAVIAALLVYKIYMLQAGAQSIIAAGEIDIATASTIGLNAAMAASPPLIAAAIAALLVWQATSKKGFIHKAIFDDAAGGIGDSIPKWKAGKWVDAQGKTRRGRWVDSSGKTIQDQRYWNRQFRQNFGGLKPIPGETPYQYTLRARNGDNAAVEANAKAMAGLARTAIAADPSKGVYHGFDVNVAIRNLEKLRALTLKPGASLAAFAAYEKAKAALESHYTGTALTALDDYLSAIESKTKKSLTKQADAAKKAATQLKSELADMATNAMNMYDTLLSQNQSIMGQLFSGPYINSPRMQNNIQYGAVPTGQDYLKDLKSQNTQFVTFYKQIGKLQRRGAPSALIQELIQAGPQALPAIKALAGMGKTQWKEYIDTFNTGQKLLHDQTIKQLESQLKDYRKYGVKIADQIIAGMRDKRLGLTNEIKNIIKNMFGVVVPTVHHATKTAAKHAAKHTATHAAHQARAYNPNETNSHPIVGTTTRSTQGVTVHHTSYHVTAPSSEHTSVKAQLRHAEFIRRTRYGVTP